MGDHGNGENTHPVPFVVTEGEEIDLLVRFSQDGVVVQFELQRVRS
eukprot:NODE_16546_length_203_cov_5.512987_g15632_i0.p2 GENE.NODE_16546_length_203_cov_5.512987_g15632_i0~~NODE_16546_length_203_cov_5.512987_g15632_i0.p2  ORF type:complete len:53 (-),score=13.95 NODE_16546_length_203_cov_5.512987_g15632_i0:44-181(-)